jgi:accessory colonization factor AcfC
MRHELKIWPQYYARVADGSKTFEIRDNDRGFQPGDTVVLKEWNPNKESEKSVTPIGWTDSPPLEFKIGYVFVLDSNRVVFSLLPIKKKTG